MESPSNGAVVSVLSNEANPTAADGQGGHSSSRSTNDVGMVAEGVEVKGAELSHTPGRAAPRKKKRRKAGGGGAAMAGGGGSSSGGRGRAPVDGDKRHRARLLTDAAKIARDDPDALTTLLGIVSSVQAVALLQAGTSSSFAGELMSHLVRLLPRAVVSSDTAAIFIECLDPFEDLEEYVLPASLYRAITSTKEPPPLVLRGHEWKRKKERALAGAGTTATASSLEGEASTITGLQTLREYLCMNGTDALECGRRTVVATLTRALLGSWDGSVHMGRQLFDQSVLKNPDRSGPVGLGLEMLLQSLVQDDVNCAVENEGTTARLEEGSSASESEGDHPNRRLGSHARSPDQGTSSLSPPDEARACVTIVGNYVRADADTASSFFRDLIPTVMLAGCGGSGRGRGREGSQRVPARLASMLRSLVNSTRSRDSFNVERMIVHTVKEMKDWGDPAEITSTSTFPLNAAMATLEYDIPEGGGSGPPTERKTSESNKGGSTSDKQRRRGLILACLDVLGPTPSCMSLIRREMVNGESTANLRSAVAGALLEYRRTCDATDFDAAQALSLCVLSSLAEDSFVGVRLSAVGAVGEACSSRCVPAASLLLHRCLDTSSKVRGLAVRILTDDFRLSNGAAGTALARDVLLQSSSQDQNSTSRPSMSDFTAGTGPREKNGKTRNIGGGSGEVVPRAARGGLLGRLLRHHEALQETDKEKFPALLRGLVRVVLRGEQSSGRGNHEWSARKIVSVASAIGSIDKNKYDDRSNTDGDGGSDDGVDRTDDDGALLALDRFFDGEARGMSHYWDDLAAPAARLCAACQPFEPAHLDAIDRIVGGIHSL